MPAEQKPRVYTVATAHLDTSWLWDLETTIMKYIPQTLKKNFALFEAFPDYVFNFEGSYRYELMEEYYPQLFEKLRYYVEKGNWVPTGSSYENGDVNTPSPEALFRNILYGNDYFRKQFGKPCDDIFLPDCFGFGWALPSVAAHANLHGFSTQKLTWSSAYGIPFELGKWYGVDGSFIYASLRPGPYGSNLKQVREDAGIKGKLEQNLREFNLPMTNVFHGVGDRGGSPSKRSVRTVMREQAGNASSAIDVVSTSPGQLFADMRGLPQEQQDSLPVWNDELLLTAHGVGSYTSRAVGKRWNRRCEQLADAAERSASMASFFTQAEYPKQNMERAWKRFIAHQFHDDITGTSFQRCYQRNWNDYVQSMNQFAEEYRAASQAVASQMNSSFVQGIAVIVSNPVQAVQTRNESVHITLDWLYTQRAVCVRDASGRELPSQLNFVKDGKADITFCAEVPSVGYAVFDVQPAQQPYAGERKLTITATSLENAFVRIELDAQGQISSVYDKAAGKEALRAPIRLTVIDNLLTKTWPAWEIQYADVMREKKETPRLVSSRILEQGAARVVLELRLELMKSGRKTSFTQLLSLDTYSRFLRVENEVDWYCAQSMLKVEYPLACANEQATYDIGLGTIRRGVNTEKLYEVPAQIWADQEEEEEDTGWGVSLFSDSRAGWDKPDAATLRLTVVQTPKSSYRWECAQHIMDFGLNRFGFGVYVHQGDWRNGTQNQAVNFQQPLQCFTAPTHAGQLGASVSFARLDRESVLLRCLKQAENSEELVVRFQEAHGAEQTQVRFAIAAGIVAARELFADEEYRGEATLEDGELVFDLSPYEPKTFALTLQGVQRAVLPRQTALPIEYSTVAITANNERSKATTPANLSFPREIMPQTILSGGVEFSIAQGQKNALACGGQRLGIPADAKEIHLLACALGQDTHAELCFDGKPQSLRVQCMTQAIGAWDLPGMQITGYLKRDTLAFTATHAHSAMTDRVAKQLYLFKYSFAVPEGAKTFTLPNNRNILLFAVTATQETLPLRFVSEPYESQEKRPFVDVLNKHEKRYSSPSFVEKMIDKVIDRDKSFLIETRWGSFAFQYGDIYYGIRKVLSGSK